MVRMYPTTNIPMFDWKNATDQERCKEYKRLDAKFNTVVLSPLHHDARCPIHHVKGTY